MTHQQPIGLTDVGAPSSPGIGEDIATDCYPFSVLRGKDIFMSETCIRPQVPNFETVEDLKRGLTAKANFEHVDLYPRDGSVLLGEVEAKVAELAGVSEEQLLVYNYGMAAVTDAIDAALYAADKPTPVLACSQETYTQTKRYIENFIRGNRAKVVYFNSGNNDEIARVIDERQPDVIVTETISNYINVPVLDTQFLLNYASAREKPPVIVLDNTLPLSTGLPLDEMLTEEAKVIVVESGTKSYGLNAAPFGVGYTKNTELHDWLRRYRRTRGSLPVPASLELIAECLPESREAFDDRNYELFQTTGQIALALAARAEGNTDFVISHPVLPHHTNHDFYTTQYPDGGTPLFYIQSDRFDQFEIGALLWDNDDVREQAQLGQSFGFDHSRIVYDEYVAAVRIVGGTETDGEALGEACAAALYGR